MDTSVVIPVYNSEEILVELVRQLSDALSPRDYEVILVNDESADASWARIRELAEADPRVVGVNLRKNSGQDNAIMAGLKLARGDYIVIMDDDLQHSPADIPKLRSACEESGADVCYAQFPRKKQAAWKNLGSWFNGKMADKIIGKPDSVYLSPFKIMKGELGREIVKYDGPYPYVDGLIFAYTRHVVQTEIDHHKRIKGRSNYNLLKSVKVFMKLATSFSIFPLRIASFLGFLMAIVGFGLGGYFLIEYFSSHEHIAGWTSIAVLLLAVGGILMVSLGMIGEYLGRAYLTLNRRPQYSIKEIICGERKAR
jgi:polyisoprenyl-phosphate glycosyltransferase